MTQDDVHTHTAHRHRWTGICLRAHTGPHVLHRCVRVPREAQEDTDTPRGTHRHPLLPGFRGDAHGQPGPGEPARQDDSCMPVPVSWAAAGQRASSRLDRHAHQCSEDPLAACPPLRRGTTGHSPVPPALGFFCRLGSIALEMEILSPALSIWESVAHGCRQGAFFVSPAVSHICPDLLGSWPAHLCM